MERICKHCQQIFNLCDKPKSWMANHSRWCSFNPKISKYKEDAKQRIYNNPKMAMEGIKGTNQFIKAKLNNIKLESKLKGRPSKLKGYKHTEEAKSKISKAALSSNHRRLRKNPIEYNGVILDSRWEFELAKRLDYLKIRWIRPEPLKWKDDNDILHNYFPDFYLPEFDLYLDPKNQHAYNIQIDKINILNKLYNIRWILTLEECINFNI